MTTTPPDAAGAPTSLPDAFYAVSATIVCTTEADAMDVAERIKAAFATEREEINRQPTQFHRVGLFATFVIKLERAQLGTLIRELGAMAAQSQNGASTGVIGAIANALRRSRAAGGN